MLKFRHKHSEIIGSLLLIGFIFWVVFGLIEDIDGKEIDYLVIASFFAIGIWSLFKILTDKYIYSLQKMHWYFVLVFMSIAPMLQQLSGYEPWGFQISNHLLLMANSIVGLWCVAFEIGCMFMNGKEINNNRQASSLKITKSTSSILCVVSIASLFIMVVLVGFNELAIRASADLDGTSNALFTILNYLLRAIPAISLGALLISKKSKAIKPTLFDHVIIICLVAIVIVLNNPISLSRYWVAVVYLGLLLCAVPANYLSNRKFDIILIISLCIVFPAMSFFKTQTLDAFLTDGIGNFIARRTSVFNTVDFDAYSMLCRIVAYVDDNGLSMGQQIKSTIFFFVPRSVLPIKGTPTGELVAEAQGQSYVNVSAPIMGEGYMDFGLLGVIIFGFIFAIVISKADAKFWVFHLNGDSEYADSVRYFDLCYLFSFGFIVFIMRGSLQPTFLRYMGFMLFILIMYFIERAKMLFTADRNSL